MTEMSDGPTSNPIRVLIGFAEALAAVEVTRSLRGAGIEVSAFTREGAKPILGRLLGDDLHPIPAPEAGVDAAIAAVGQTVDAVQPDIVLPLDDMALWLMSKTSSSGESVTVPPLDGIKLALDKRLQLEAARAAGFQVPPTEIVEDRESAAHLSGFPLVLRPALAARPVDGRLGRAGADICADAEELDSALRAWSGAEPLLVQPYIRGVGEGLFACAKGGELYAPSAHRRVRMMNPHGSGASACTWSAVDPSLVEAASRMARDLRWEGMFMVELLRDAEGTPWFVEWNGRAWGSLALARRRGLEYPRWSVQAAMGMEPDSSAPVDGPPFVCRHAGREFIHLLQVMRGPRSPAVTDWPPRLRTLLDVLRVRRKDRWYNLEDRDWRLFLVDAFQTVLHQVRRRKKGAG